jgi:hypothetical protein
MINIDAVKKKHLAIGFKVQCFVIEGLFIITVYYDINVCDQHNQC